MFAIWAWERSVNEEAAHLLIHAALHIHLADVLDGKEKPYEQLAARGEYRKRETLVTVFPFLVLYTKQSKLPLTDDQLVNYLSAEPALKDISEDEFKEIVIEWRRRQVNQW